MAALTSDLALLDPLLLLGTGLFVGASVVLLLTWRRRRPLGRDSPSHDQGPPARATPADLLITPLHVSDEPLIQLEVLDAPTARGREAPPALRSQMSALTHALAAGAEVAAGRTVRLTFAPHLQAGLDSGALRLMTDGKSTFAIVTESASGKIAGHGRLVTAVNPASVALAAWQVASMVTAQHYLHAIDGRLSAIEDRLTAIQDWLEDEQWARLHAATEAVHGWLDALAHTTPSPADRTHAAHRLEHVDHELSEVMTLMVRQLDRLADRTTGLDVRKTWTRGGMEQASQQLAEIADDQARYVSLWSDAVAVRMMAAALRPTTGLEAVDARRRVVRLAEQSTRFREERILALDDAYREQARQLSATFAWRSTREASREAIAKRLGDHELAAVAGRAEEAGLALVAQMDRTAQPMVIEAALDESGDVREAWMAAEA